MIDLYRKMIRIRTFEEKVRELSVNGMIPGRLGFYSGQEAVAVGISAHLKPEDQIGSTHRPLGHLIAKGCDLKKLMAELCAKKTGLNKGKAGPYHIFDPSVGVLGANGIVGGSVPMCAGYALSNQLYSPGTVAVSYFGEGAANQGGVLETLNLAACWNLPMIFVCENSSLKTQRMLGHEINFPQMKIDCVSIRAKGYGMNGSTHIGWDVLEVYQVAEKVIKQVRMGGDPYFLEFKVHQIEGDIEGGWMKEKIENTWCPIHLFRVKLMELGVLTDDLDEDIRSDESRLIDEAVVYSLESPEPDILDAYKGVFVDYD
jgi:pyruvate dehydrogenase E1 component alpha subunit